jgi:hypothetical protein
MIHHRTWSVAALLLPFLASLAQAQINSELPLKPGATYVTFETLPENASPASLFADSLPGAAGWAAATRILTADRHPVLGCYYDTRKNDWRGTLKKLEPGAAYWIVLPNGIQPLTITLTDVTLTAGYARERSGGVMVTVDDGVTKVTPSGPPASSATHTVVKEKPRTIKAGTGVYVQDGSGTGGGSPGPMMWVSVPLDTAFTRGKAMKGSLPVPLSGGGIVTVLPPPDFSRPPWGKGPVPE